MLRRLFVQLVEIQGVKNRGMAIVSYLLFLIN